jgi:hypothetical protein
LDILEGGLKGELQARAWFDPASNNIYQGKVSDTGRVIFNARNVKQAALPSITDISAVNIAILLQEILGLERPVYNLRNATRIIPMNALKATIPIFTKPTASEKVPALTEASLESAGWSSITFQLWKNVAHIVMPDEIEKMANVDIFGTQTRDAAGALAASENSQISAAFAAAGGAQPAASGLWSAISSGGNSTYNPYTDIISAMTTIATAGYRPTSVVMHPTGWAPFFGNSYVKGLMAGAAYPDLSQGGGFPLPGLPGVTGFSDFFITPTTSCYVLDPAAAIILGSGPTEAARYRNEAAGYDAFIMRQWLQPLTGVTTAIEEITNVHA